MASLFCFLALVAGQEPAPWSDLLPAAEAADQVVLAEVTGVDFLAPVGQRVTLKVKERFRGSLRPGGRVAYLASSRDRSRPGDLQLLFLEDPPPDGWHHRLQGRVSSRSPGFERRLAWFRDVWRLRILTEPSRGAAYLRLYVTRLRSEDPWIRGRALAELERLFRERFPEVRRRLLPEQFDPVLKALPEGRTRERVQALKNRLREGGALGSEGSRR